MIEEVSQYLFTNRQTNHNVIENEIFLVFARATLIHTHAYTSLVIPALSTPQFFQDALHSKTKRFDEIPRSLTKE